MEMMDFLGPGIVTAGVLVLGLGIYMFIKERNTRKKNLRRIAEVRGKREDDE